MVEMTVNETEKVVNDDADTSSSTEPIQTSGCELHSTSEGALNLFVSRSPSMGLGGGRQHSQIPSSGLLLGPPLTSSAPLLNGLPTSEWIPQQQQHYLSAAHQRSPLRLHSSHLKQPLTLGDSRCGSKGVKSGQISYDKLPFATSNPLTANRRIHIGNLKYPFPLDYLRFVFGDFGKITAFTPQRGYVFLEYEDEESPKKAIKAFADGKKFMDYKISIIFLTLLIKLVL